MRHKGRLAVVCLLILVRAGLCQSSSKWLVIAASKSEVVPAIKASRDLRDSWPGALVAASSDCPALRPGLYLTVAAIAASRLQAETALQKLRPNVPDAYIKECSPKPNSMLAFGLSLVDNTIADVPSDSVNWSDSDRISSVRRLPQGGYLWIRRKYLPENDPLEGRVVSVIYFERQPQSRVELQSNCIDPEDAQHGTLLALNCAREVAGDYLLHETIVFDMPAGTRIKSIQHCRKPVFDSDGDLTCEEEHVDAQGKLGLAAKRVALR